MNRYPLLSQLLSLALLICAGCSAGVGPERIDVKGKVAYRSQPIPAGVISFDPDPTKGNGGPQGFAFIVKGEFDTSKQEGKGPVPGDVIMRIYGFDGINPSELAPHGSPLFLPPYETSINVTDESNTFDVNVQE